MTFSLGPHGDLTTFLLPTKFSYDAQENANGDTLEAFLQGCRLFSRGADITIDISFDGQTKTFRMLNKGWISAGIRGHVLVCDQFLKDAVRITGQFRGTQLIGKYKSFKWYVWDFCTME